MIWQYKQSAQNITQPLFVIIDPLFLSLAPQWEWAKKEVCGYDNQIINVIQIWILKWRLVLAWHERIFAKNKMVKDSWERSSGNKNSSFVCQSVSLLFFCLCTKTQYWPQTCKSDISSLDGRTLLFVSHRMFDILSVLFQPLSHLILFYFAAFTQSSVMKPNLSWYDGESSSDGTFMHTTCLLLWEQVVLGSFLCLWLWQSALDSDLAPFCLVNRRL